MYQKILVAIDKSEIGESVFEQGVFLAKAADAQMMILHVLSPLEDPYISPVFTQPDIMYPSVAATPMGSYMEDWEKLKKERRDWLQSLTETAINAGVKTEFTQNLGDAGRLICEVASNWPADLILAGRRGRTGLSEFFLGSVSNYVLHHAPCSMLIVQGNIPKNTEISAEN
ncbi:universal stress protein [Nodularia harveyana UHCC-0300]|uniref:Universal stress protein n=1 Tax=Nodularia harveyana UHCC-0300 TaxID=2974287 RepID=A0ABU5U8E2_9CYAN|nr:universal stress protein [Nodularia harveyana]MEA5579787.1 universal stress protein [Nodularia harveyana UHCC-0300]